MPLVPKPPSKRTLAIVQAIYVDDATYALTGQQLGLSTVRVRQIYARFAWQCLSRRYRPDRQKYGPEFTLLDETFIPIDKELAQYNVAVRSGGMSRWSSSEMKADGFTLTRWRSDLHRVIMVQRTLYDDGVEKWECNEHFFDQSLDHPERQTGKSGIYTQLP